MLQAFDRTRRLLPRDCGDTISWSAGCVEKAQPNAIDMPCDTKAWTMHFIRSQYDSVIVQAMMEFFVSHKNTNKGGEVMDSGASSYHICGSIDKNKIMRGNYHGQRYFYKA